MQLEKRYKPNYTCACGFSFHTVFDERLELFPGGEIACPKCSRRLDNSQVMPQNGVENENA